MTDRIPLNGLTNDALDQLYDRAEGAEAARDRLLRSRDRQAARANTAEARVTELKVDRDRYSSAWQSARLRVKRAKRNRDGELRWAEGMWSDALRDLHRYRKAWTSARHRAALYLQSNQNLATSLDNNHAAYLQLAAASALPGDKRTCCHARIGHVPGCPVNQPPTTA